MTAQNSHTAAGWLGRLSLRRVITSNRFIPEVDGFRFLAILIVVISHIYVQCTPPSGGGPLSFLMERAFLDGKHGVYLFFTISGFILALPFARHHLTGDKPVAIGNYFQRRLTRLEPPYVIAMLARTPALLVYKGLTFAFVAPHLVASLLYVHNLVFGQYSIINPPAWSLEVEIQFYILAPLLTTVFLIRSAALRRVVLIAAILLPGIIALLYIAPMSRLSLTLVYYFQYFAAGFLLCDLYLTRSHFALPPLAWDLIGTLALSWILFSHSPWYFAALPFAAIALYMAGFFGRVIRGVFSLRTISTIGGMCYSIYLTHTLVLTAVNELIRRLHIAALPIPAQEMLIYTASFAGILALGTLYFILIERPCMDPHWPLQLATRLGLAPKVAV